MQTAIVAPAATGDTASDTATAGAPVVAATAGDAKVAGVAVAALAATCHTDPDPALAGAALVAPIAGVAETAVVAAAALTATRDTDPHPALAGAALAAAIAGAACPAGVSVMMIPGSIDANSNWVEANSLARAVEEAMVAAGVLQLQNESHQHMQERRKSFVAVATGLISYVQANMELRIPAKTWIQVVK